MTVSVRVPTVLRHLVEDQHTVEANGATVGEVFADLETRYPGFVERIVRDDELHRFVNVFLNDEDVRYLRGLSTPVESPAEIAILPAVAGG